MRIGAGRSLPIADMVRARGSSRSSCASPRTRAGIDAATRSIRTGASQQERQSIEAPQAAAVARKQALDLLDRALGSIDMGRRAVLVLHEIEQMTAPEIARTLELPLNTVYSRLRVARVELDAELARLSSADTARDEEAAR